MLADTISDDDLAAVEDAFFMAAGLTDAEGLQFLAKRLAASRLDDEPTAEHAPAAEQPDAATAGA